MIPLFYFIGKWAVDILIRARPRLATAVAWVRFPILSSHVGRVRCCSPSPSVRGFISKSYCLPLSMKQTFKISIRPADNGQGEPLRRCPELNCHFYYCDIVVSVILSSYHHHHHYYYYFKQLHWRMSYIPGMVCHRPSPIFLIGFLCFVLTFGEEGDNGKANQTEYFKFCCYMYAIPHNEKK